MRYRLAAVMLFALLPVLNVLAVPAPERLYAILDIGTPRKGETVEAYRRRYIEGQTSHYMLSRTWCDPEVKKLPSIAPMKDPRPWLAKNFRITAEGERRLRCAFRAGTRAEQVTIINALLRVNLQGVEESIKSQEEGIRSHEKCILELEQRIKSSRDPQEIASYQKGISELRSIRIPERRAEIARLKLFAVIRWAK